MFLRPDKTIQVIWSHVAQMRFEEALELALTALEHVDDPYHYYRVLGFTHVHMDELGTAADYFAKALELKPCNFRAMLALGNTLYADGRYEEAREHFELIVRRRPRFGTARKKLMAIYKHLGLMYDFYRTKAESDMPILMPYPLRRRLLDGVVRAYSSTYRPPLHKKLVALKNVPLAGSVAQACLLTGKHLPRFNNGSSLVAKAEGLFQTLLDEGNRDEAAELIAHFTQDAELAVPILEQLVSEFANAGRPAKAAELFEILESVSEPTPLQLALLGEMRLQLGDYAGAEAALAKSNEKLSDSAMLDVTRQGCQAMLSKNYQAAADSWRQAFTQAGSFTTALMLLRALRHACDWQALDAKVQGVPVEHDWQRALVMREQGLALLARRDDDEARRLLLEASKLDTSLYADADDILYTARYRQRGPRRNVDGDAKPNIALVHTEGDPIPAPLAALANMANLYLYYPDEGPALFRDADELDGLVILATTPSLERDIRNRRGTTVLVAGCKADLEDARHAETTEEAAQLFLGLFGDKQADAGRGPLLVSQENASQAPADATPHVELVLTEHDAPLRRGGEWKLEHGIRTVSGRSENIQEIIRLISGLYGLGDIASAPGVSLPQGVPYEKDKPRGVPAASSRRRFGAAPSGRRRVVMTVNNPGTTDNRVFKAAQAAVRNGYECHLVGFMRDGFPQREVVDGVVVHRIVPPAISELPWRWALRRPPRPMAAANGQGEGEPDTSTTQPVPSPWHTLTQQIFLKITGAMRVLGQLPRMQQWQYFHAFYSQVAALEPDLIHCHDLWPLEACVAAGKATGAKVIYDSHELEAHRNILWTPSERRCWAALESSLLPRLNGVITVSDGIARELERQFKGRSVEVIHNTPWCPTESGQSPASAPETPPAATGIRTAAGVGDEVPLIVYVGYITFGRGIEKLVQCMQFYPEAHIALVGPIRKAMLPKFKDLAELQGAQDRLHIIPPVPPADLIPFISTADVSAIIFQGTCLSHYYIKPNKLFESVFAGLPVVVPPFPDIARFVAENEVGRVFSSDSPQDLADALRETIQNKDRFFAGGRIDQLRDYFCYENCVNQLATLYASVLGDE